MPTTSEPVADLLSPASNSVTRPLRSRSRSPEVTRDTGVQPLARCAMATLRAAAPRPERLERRRTCSPAGWTCRLSATGRGRGTPRRRADGRGGPAARRRAHLAAAPGDLDGEHRARRLRPALDPGASATGGSTSATTGPCRARTRSRPSPSSARSSSCSGGGRTTSRRRRSSRAASSPRTATRATPTSAPTCRRTECLADVVTRFLPYYEELGDPGPAGGQGRAARRARQLAAGAGQAPRRHLRRRRSPG